MKRLLQLGFILGLGGTLAAAYFVPWITYERYRTAASVVANGGRVEQFVVRLPADRIGAAIDTAHQGGESKPPVRLEHFKVRDVEGNVIGILARHRLAREGESDTSWLLTIPSRGTIAFAATTRAPARSVESVLAARGVAPGESIEPELSIDLGAPARSVAATGEFTDIEFELVETWVVTGREDDGATRGTLRLNTVGRRST